MSEQNKTNETLSLEEEFKQTNTTYDPPKISEFKLPFDKTNYRYMIISIALLIIGYFLLSVGDGFVDATEFSIPLHVAPFVITAGYVGLIYAILHKSKKA